MTDVTRCTMFRLTATTTARRACTTALLRQTAATRVPHSRSLVLRALPAISRCPNPALVFKRYESSDAKPSAKTCPSCSAPLPTNLPACPSCFTIQPLPQETSFYEILQIPEDVRFDIDDDLLKRNFRQIQRVIHPDKWSSKGPVSTSEIIQIVCKPY